MQKSKYEMLDPKEYDLLKSYLTRFTKDFDNLSECMVAFADLLGCIRAIYAFHETNEPDVLVERSGLLKLNDEIKKVQKFKQKSQLSQLAAAFDEVIQSMEKIENSDFEKKLIESALDVPNIAREQIFNTFKEKVEDYDSILTRNELKELKLSFQFMTAEMQDFSDMLYICQALGDENYDILPVEKKMWIGIKRRGKI